MFASILKILISFIMIAVGVSLFAQQTSIKEVKGLLNLSSSGTSMSFDRDLNMVDKPLLYDNGILFTYYGDKEDEVYLSGDFNEWKIIPMKKNSKGIFYYFLTSTLKKGNYGYRFRVNGVWVNDQEQPFFKVDIHNQRVSYFHLPRDIIFTIPVSPEPIDNGKYRFYLKDEGYRDVSLITDANNWEPGFTAMTLENGYWYVDYYWGKHSLLYTYWVDGKKKFDPHNLSRTITPFNLTVNFFQPSVHFPK